MPFDPLTLFWLIAMALLAFWIGLSHLSKLSFLPYVNWLLPSRLLPDNPWQCGLFGTASWLIGLGIMAFLFL